MPRNTKPARRCRTAEDAFEAGWDDGADDEPLTDGEIVRMVALHAPHIRNQDQPGAGQNNAA